MEIQRVKFLLLASALAAPACTVNETNVVGGDASTGGAKGSTGGNGTGTGGRVSTGGSATTGGSTSTGGVSTGGSGTGGSGNRDASAGGTDGSAGGRDGSTGGTKNDGGPKNDASTPIDASRPDGNTCDDTTITGGFENCNLLAADACSIGSFQVAQCEGAKTNMKPFIAQTAIHCYIENAAACDATTTYTCKKNALTLVACPDNTDTDCGRIKSACSAIDLAECNSYLKGMTQAGRDGMVSCMETSCTSLYSCVESL